MRELAVIVRPSSSSVSATGSVGPGDLVSNSLLFSYNDPLLSYVELRALDDAILEKLSAPPPANFVVLTAHGSNFGPQRALLNDVVVRQLLLRPTTASGAPLPNSTFSTTGTIEVRLHARVDVRLVLSVGWARIVTANMGCFHCSRCWGPCCVCCAGYVGPQ